MNREVWQPDLTNTGHPSHNVVMPPDQGQEMLLPQPSEENLQPTVGKSPRVTPERIEEARRAWELSNTVRERRGEVISVDEKGAQRVLVEMGRGPMSGGAEPLRLTDFTDPRLQNIVREINDRIAGSAGQPLDLEFITEMIGRISGLVDEVGERRVDPQEARMILNNLRVWRVETIEGSERRRAGEEGVESRRGVNYSREITKVFEDPAIIEELRKGNPDLTKETLRPLRHFMETFLDPTDNGFTNFADFIANTENEQLPISDASRRLLYEWLFERIIGRPDMGPEESSYDVGQSFVLRNNFERIRTIAQRSEKMGLDFYRYLEELMHIRMVAHELNRNLRHGEKYREYVASYLRTGGLDFMQNVLAGSGTVVSLYEKIAPYKVSERKTWFTESDIKSISEEVRDTFEKMFEAGLVVKGERKLTEWEKERALRIGRILFAGTQRMAMYASLGSIPPDANTTEKIGSLPYEYIGRALVPFKMIAARFFGGGQKSGSHRLLERIFEEQEVITSSNYVSLFGLDKRVMMVDSYGAKDPESHSWRSQLMFLGTIKMRSGENNFTLLDYLNHHAERYAEAGTDPLLGGDVADKTSFSRDVQDAVLGQRLYLSVLSRYGNFDTDLKTKIWKKIATLKPSTVVSLLPDVKGHNNETWGGLRQKLYIAEMARVINDSQMYARGLDEDDLRMERARVDRLESDPTRYEIFNYFSEQLGNSLTSDEEVLLKQIIDNGIREAGYLANAEMPFIFAIDDAPVIAWKKTTEGSGGLADEDLFRLLLSDQQSLTEGWNEMSSFVESPTTDVIKHIATAVDKIGSVHGRATAQNIIDPFVTAYVKFASTDELTLLTPGLMSVSRAIRRPTSELEEYFRDSFISMDEKDRADFLLALAQAKAIRDNVVDQKDGLTQLDRIAKKTRSSRAWVMMRMLRIIIFLLGPEVAYELFKIAIPEELTKH